jgi:choline dehydrogenase-like flavoprotein
MTSSGQPSWMASPVDGALDADIVVVGTGMGGAAAAWALRGCGARVLLLERGTFLPREPDNWSPKAVFLSGRYKNAEPWYDGHTGQPFKPGVHYYVGGNTKVYGASLPRFREQDFGEIQHHGGISPSWPFTYAHIEKFYCLAEQMLDVHGLPGVDPTEPWHSLPLPQPALEHEPAVQALADSMRAGGLHPFLMPMGVDYGPDGSCVRCRTCDGFPCKLGAKNDGETRGIRPALEAGNVSLLPHARVRRLLTDSSGRRVTSAIAETPAGDITVTATYFIVAAGAANTAALLLASANANHLDGLANSSGQLGRNYMVHNSTFLVGLNPRRRNRTQFQKTLGLNDWYLTGPDGGYPLGNVQMLGKLQGAMIKPARPLIPVPLLEAAATHTIDLYLTTEDLPAPDNRVTVGPDGRITVLWKPNNLTPHRQLLALVKRVLHKSGYLITAHQRMGIETNSHMCGTAVMGHDPSRSVLNPDGRAHDLENMWITDSSGFPSSAAVNPALTIAANSLRIIHQAGLADAPGPVTPHTAVAP